ncbi:cation diffusion facilitator family transporter [Andreprevotia chitinilytica]|uniref:cation diffusion facilitator family transporter n=1 Tax=Andreprevotia chitinilytica TaxID=396808 RepID=UPI000552A8A5|nr:cation diffusion facilitator family transporter [Andreprevotia chitinilytica]
MSHGADSVKSILYALAANLAIALSKLAAAMATGSGSMLAEAVHSFADCGNQGLLLWGLKTAGKPPSKDYPLGHGKEIYFWSFIVALMLFSIGGVFSIYEGLHKLAHPEPLAWPWVAVGVLAFGVVAESISMWGVLKEINKTRGGKSLWRWVRESRQSELVVVLGEDAAALLGLTFALVAILLAIATGNPMWDALGSVAIGVLLVVVAAFIGTQIKGLLIGKSVEPDVDQAMRSWLTARPEITRVFNLITLQMGSDVMLSLKAEFAEQGSQTGLIDAINRVEDELQAAFPQLTWVFVEPDNKD